MHRQSFWNYVIIALILSALTACSEADPSQVSEDPVVNTESAPPAGQTNSTGGIAWAQKRYERTLEMERSGLLRCDTVAYTCDAVSGTFTFCHSDGELVRAGHERQMGDHDYLIEWYYYDGEDMYLADLKEGSWRFGSPDSDGQVPLASTAPTIDEVHEERRFYERGNLLDRRFRDYTMRSWTDTLHPHDLPEMAEGTGVADAVGSEVVLRVAESGSYDCR